MLYLKDLFLYIKVNLNKFTFINLYIMIYFNKFYNNIIIKYNKSFKINTFRD